MILYEKINKIKEGILKANLKKSGYNKFSNFSYYELADITPTIIQLCNEYNVMTQFSFDKEYAKLLIVDVEKPEDNLIYLSPMEELEIKGANKIQALGGTETYQRRYLYMMAFDIIESDMFDATAGMTDEDKAKAYTFMGGKYKGKAILDIYKEDKNYLQWCLDNGKNDEVKAYIELITDLKRTQVPNEEEQIKRLELINKVLSSGKDIEEIRDKYNILSIQELSTEQLEAIVNE